MDFRRLFAGREHPLHANADAKKGNAPVDAVDDGIAETGIIQGFGCGEVADTGQDNFLRLQHLCWI